MFKPDVQLVTFDPRDDAVPEFLVEHAVAFGKGGNGGGVDGHAARFPWLGNRAVARAILTDPDTKDIEEITLSYTFYPLDQAKKGS